MPLTDYRTLGRSGLVVSPLALGTMTFGQGRWGADEETSREIFDAYLDEGGNFIDTADVYSGGESERLVGRFLREGGTRDRVVLATKYGFNAGSSPLETDGDARANPLAGGSGTRNLRRAVDASLARLGTDYIDLYWMHVWDGITPAEEIVEAMGNLVRQGKILHYALSDMPAWFAARVAGIAEARGVPGPVAIQVEYSLVARGVEEEHIPAAIASHMGVVPWSPLAGGFLTGKYRRDTANTEGRLSGANPFGDSKFTERNWDILDTLRDVAGEVDASPAQVALSWTLTRPGIAATIVGARGPEQLHTNLGALDFHLADSQIDRLNAASTPAAGFTGGLASAGLRSALFGGHDVRGWIG
ncbi:aldo/keto reductase [Sulfitobacter pontiacus]|uniref:aldo/keto reductase n=1 Tax=Sulfitobacter pontiacus TaxID=60137 RepID=UPI0027552D42|nr:aldo/keto reductase [Sulfitobacter pontiacus]GLO79885.1 aldo/keto reductase [Sulfitobacter pontiacus]